MCAAKNSERRCDIAQHPMRRYIKCRRHSCNETWSFVTNLKKYSFFISLVAILVVSIHLRRRHLTYRHVGFSETKVGNGIWLENIPRNRLGTVSVIPQKKVLIPRHSVFRGRANSKARNVTERNVIPRKTEVLGNSHSLYDHSDGIYIEYIWSPHRQC